MKRGNFPIATDKWCESLTEKSPYKSQLGFFGTLTDSQMTAERIDCLACRGLAPPKVQTSSSQARTNEIRTLKFSFWRLCPSLQEYIRRCQESSSFQFIFIVRFMSFLTSERVSIDSVWNATRMLWRICFQTETINCYYLWFKLTSFFIFDLIGILDGVN